LSEKRETAYAKVNLALHVRERMRDGYHRIETVFAFCEDGDEIVGQRSESPSLDISGPFAQSLGTAENFVSAAVDALKAKSRFRSAAALQLQKMLPVASGLGGGSADAAATLRLLNTLWGLNWPVEELEAVARGLGADVPACVHSRSMRGEGRGDRLVPVDLGLSGTPVLLINPRVELKTGDVFARWDGTDRGALNNWRVGRNDLEAAATSLAPQIGGILAWLSAQRGAYCVRLSGSGPTCFALFESEAQRDASDTAVPREWWRLATRLR
jgi:4-diphosphocytidyl-2-C-methyl-D-erythritol kinase